VGLQVSGQPRGAFRKPYNYSLGHMDGSEWDYDYDFQCYFLYQHRAELYHWIDLRCEQMVAGMAQPVSFFLIIPVRKYLLYVMPHETANYSWGQNDTKFGMFADPKGLLQEASSLLDVGFMADTSSASRGIGYQEVSTISFLCQNSSLCWGDMAVC
jgi:tRNA dimethylallyltransferase